MILFDNLLNAQEAEGKPVRGGMARVRPALGALSDRLFEQGRAAETHIAEPRLEWQTKVGLDEKLWLTVDFAKSGTGHGSSPIV